MEPCSNLQSLSCAHLEHRLIVAAQALLNYVPPAGRPGAAGQRSGARAQPGAGPRFLPRLSTACLRVRLPHQRSSLAPCPHSLPATAALPAGLAAPPSRVLGEPKPGSPYFPPIPQPQPPLAAASFAEESSAPAPTRRACRPPRSVWWSAPRACCTPGGSAAAPQTRRGAPPPAQRSAGRPARGDARARPRLNLYIH